MIVGGGIAGLEAALALNQLAPDRGHVTLIAPEPEFVYKPMVVAEPFWGEPAERHELASALEELGTSFVEDSVVSVDPASHSIELGDGSNMRYDILLIAVGGRPRPAYRTAETFWSSKTSLPIAALLDQVAASPGRTLAFVVPPGCSWPLPLYELALMTQRRIQEQGPYGVRVQIFSPEESPLAIFGAPASAAVAELLRGRGIDFHAFNSIEEENGNLVTHPGALPLEAGAVIALPVIEGPAIRGIPADEHGFISVDLNLRVPGTTDIFAAGDGTTFPVKQGGLATQQADVAAEHIAAELGAPVEPTRFEPVLRGQLITGPDSLNLSHALAGGRGEGEASLDYLWWPPGKVAGRYLGPWLRGTSMDEDLAPPVRPIDVEVSLPHEWHANAMPMGEG